MDFKNLKAFMDHLTDDLVPGNAISVYYENKEVYNYASGYADIENKRPMSPDDMIFIYSCSKVATVVSAMQLLERGRYLLSDPLYEYIPEFKDMYVKTGDGKIKKAENDIKIWNLLTMTAGFNYNQNKDAPHIIKANEITKGKMNTVDVIKCLAEQPLDFEPGERWQYSLCHDVLAAFVEVVSGKKFRDYVKENIFEPVGMNNSYYHLQPGMEEKMARQYIYRTVDPDKFDMVEAQSKGSSKKGYWENYGIKNDHIHSNEYDSGGAGIITTVSDYAKFANALANNGTAQNGEKILSKGTIDLMRTNQLSPEQKRYFSWSQLRGYGYGLGVRTLIDKSQASSVGSIGEFGWGGAAGATILVDPDRKFSFFYSHHMLNPHEDYYQPRLRNAAYSGI